MRDQYNTLLEHTYMSTHKKDFTRKDKNHCHNNIIIIVQVQHTTTYMYMYMYKMYNMYRCLYMHEQSRA